MADADIQAANRKKPSMPFATAERVRISYKGNEARETADEASMREINNLNERVAWKCKVRHAAMATLCFLFWALVFGVSYTQPHLYYSNQNQYFLHGLAQGGEGFLDEDWLANTADPTPVFSGLIAFTYRHLNESLFYLYYLLVLGVYFHASTGIFTTLSGGHPAKLTRLGFITLFVVLHSGSFRWASAHLLGVDYPWYLQAGVANQFILGAGLQPSVFGVLLVLSVDTFLRGRPLQAAIWASLAAVMHSTYLLSAAFLTLSYLFVLFREKRIRDAFFTGSLALALVSPVLIYNLAMFAPSSPQAFGEAQHLLAHLRIPHHANPERWFDSIAVAQIAWILLSLYLARGTRLFPILSLTFLLSLLLTLVQLGTGNDTLALLFPWRTSSILVPIATTVILARIVNSFSFRWECAIASVCIGILALVMLGGITINYFDLGYSTNIDEIELLEWVRANKSQGDNYLLPVEVPKLTSGRRGAASLNFTPPPKRSNQRQVISVDLQRFRLFTGAPIFVDFKSIPYKDVEVLEWYERVLWNQKLYERRDWDRAIVSELHERRITRVVAATDRDIHCDALELVHKDASYRVYRIRIPSTPEEP